MPRLRAFVEEACRTFYAPVLGRPNFRLLLVGYFEGIPAWRGSLAVRSFLRLPRAGGTGSFAISRTRRLIDVETHRATWVHSASCRWGRTVAIDATTLEANAAMRSIVRYGGRLSGRFKTSFTSEPLERALQMRRPPAADAFETAIAAAEQVEAAHAAPDEEGLHEIVADKGYHSNETMVDLAAVGLRSYISEPDRGRRDWSDAPKRLSVSSGGNPRRNVRATSPTDPRLRLDHRAEQVLSCPVCGA